MKKLLMAAVVAAAMMFASDVSASPTPIAKVDVSNTVAQPEIDAVAARRGPVRAILGRLLELERRKNAWLRRTFLNG